MREIKFKGKDVKTKEWVYGFYFNVEFKDGTKRHFILEDGKDASKDKTLGELQVEVIGDTVCQFTGLYDKNGKEIYEGDIVRYTESYGCSDQEDEICESDVTINPTYIFPFSNVRDVEDCWYSVEHSEYEVVGNVHD